MQHARAFEEADQAARAIFLEGRAPQLVEWIRPVAIPEMERIAKIRMRFSTMTQMLRLAVLALLVAAPVQPAIAQLDIPGYVPCYPGTSGNLATTHPSPLTVTIDTRALRQKIHNFGASDAWSIQFVGGWPLEKREAIADLLFESGLDENRDPRGIALSTWRFNIGAGSSRQTNIGDRWRRADTFYNEDFSDYDWTRLPGQRRFLQAAKARGVKHMTAFVNSPPTNMTKNGNAFAGAFSGSTNLADGKVDDFARYLADILAHFRSAEGIDFSVISPVNEPQWSWERNSGQEGNRYSTSDIKRVIDALAEVDLGGTRIEMPESGENAYFYLDALDDYIDAFFDSASPDYVGDKIDNAVAGHSYWTDTISSGLIRSRQFLRAKLNQYPGMEFAMSEYAILGDSGPGRDLGITPALRIARTAHYDLTITEASSWQWWLGVSPYDYKDGLVYIDYRRINGNFYESKMLWAMGNFSRFIRPGMMRVTTSRSDGSTPRQDATGLMVSSYVDAPHNIAVSVFVNWAQVSKTVALDFQGMEIDSLIPYVTSATGDLAPYALLTPSDQVAIPARSIVTLVGYHSVLSLPPRKVNVSAQAAAVRVTRPGVIPVAILGESEFDVDEIDLATLEFGPGGAQPAHRNGGHRGDVNEDGIIDLVSHFNVREVSLDVGDELACATGNTFDGRAFEGCDAIRTLP
jgi:O-glycosyl hydrolase